jgi:hypothetical protein
LRGRLTTTRTRTNLKSGKFEDDSAAISSFFTVHHGELAMARLEIIAANPQDVTASQFQIM